MGGVVYFFFDEPFFFPFLGLALFERLDFLGVLERFLDLPPVTAPPVAEADAAPPVGIDAKIE